MEYGVIMAGGSGTRLWPLSRANRPKQLLPVVHGKSLLRLSYDRLRALFPADRIYVCTAGKFAEQVLSEIPELPADNLLGEPVGRDTSNAIGFSAAVLAKRDPDAVMAVVTADHVIEPVDTFADSLRAGFKVVEKYPNALVAFGITPTHGHTGLGYIQRSDALPVPGAYSVQGFKEKPDKPTADRYVESGRYYWNSGMFVWRSDAVLGELQQHLPESYAGLQKIAAAWDTPQRKEVLESIYPTLPKISIDYAVMEPASQGKGKARVAAVEMNVQWLDVGSWPALAETLANDESDNALDADTCVMVDSYNNIIVSDDPNYLVSAIGINDMIIVHTRDATLVCPKNEAQRVKELVDRLKQKFGDRYQ